MDDRSSVIGLFGAGAMGLAEGPKARRWWFQGQTPIANCHALKETVDAPRAGAGPVLIPFRRALWALAAAAIISGCGAVVQSPSYYPPVTSRPATAATSRPSHIVRASWYGPGFQGRRTTSGEVFNEHSFTAASRTLPLGSRVRVTNLSTGRSVVVKVNDRGPFVRGRSLDLSQAAARRIGVTHAGVAEVRVTRLNAHRIEPVSASVSPHDETDANDRPEPTSRTWLWPLGLFGSGK